MPRVHRVRAVALRNHQNAKGDHPSNIKAHLMDVLLDRIAIVPVEIDGLAGHEFSPQFGRR
jgi:hypothetical protein